MKSCKTCAYWDMKALDHEYGLCRRHAPRAVDRDEDRDIYGVWPITLETDWCGEYMEPPHVS